MPRRRSRIPLEFTPEGVLLAYRHAVFPMAIHDEDGVEEIGWFRPDPRTIIPLNGFHVSRSLAKVIRQRVFEIRIDIDFEGVMRGCADRAEGSWITEDFIEVYCELHRRGVAHSVETWRDGKLVGGTYGLNIGAAFMAESMFHYETNASKVALWGMVEQLKARGFALLDVQYLTPHLESLGAIEIPGALYYEALQQVVDIPRCFI